MIKYELTSPDVGKILIAEPFMADGNFVRSVILITAYEEEGVVGFILNKPTAFNINELTPDFGNEYGFDPIIYSGGPVERDTLHFVHKLGSELDGSIKIGDDLWWGGDAEQLSQKIKLNMIDAEKIRFFMGYSGWDKQQLKEEIDQKTWIVSNNFDELVFDDEADNSFWRKTLRKLGGDYIEVSKYPKDIHWN